MNFLFKCSVQAQKIDGGNEDENDEILIKKRTSFIEHIGFINMVLVYYETEGRISLLPNINTNDEGNEDDNENEDVDTGVNEAGDGTASEDDNEIFEH